MTEQINGGDNQPFDPNVVSEEPVPVTDVFGNQIATIPGAATGEIPEPAQQTSHKWAIAVPCLILLVAGLTFVGLDDRAQEWLWGEGAQVEEDAVGEFEETPDGDQDHTADDSAESDDPEEDDSPFEEVDVTEDVSAEDSEDGKTASDSLTIEDEAADDPSPSSSSTQPTAADDESTTSSTTTSTTTSTEPPTEEVPVTVDPIQITASPCNPFSLRQGEFNAARLPCGDGFLEVTGDVDVDWNGLVSRWEWSGASTSVIAIWEVWTAEGQMTDSDSLSWSPNGKHASTDLPNDRYQELRITAGEGTIVTIHEHADKPGASLTLEYIAD